MEAAGRPHFGALLRQFRLDAGMTQQELSERAKLSVEAISTLERGARTRPYRETVVLLGRALGLSPEREMLLRSAIGVPHPSLQRERSDTLSASLLRLVRPDAQGTPRHNLPAQLTSFVGRQREVADIAALLSEHRLVTVVGAGGVGKTRVALQLASALIDDCSDGVWLVDLAPIAEKTVVASAVLAALQLPPTSGTPLDIVSAYLKTHRLLLILDNCEHIIDAAREVATTIIELCPHVRVLSTSREALGVEAEWVYRLPSLACPPDSSRTAQDALRYGAVALFVDRALAVNAGFVLTNDNALEVGEICRRLDGIPLAIELAAARVKVLAPQQIAERLDKRFRLLTGGDPRALPRHQTMTALIDWSYDLLTSQEQKFFEALSVFANGCTLAAVTAVCGHDDDEDDITVIDLVSSLVTKSLLVAELVGTEQRYRLLESSRQYARDKLIVRSAQDEVARRHATFYVELAERFGRAWDTTPERVWLPAVKVELRIGARHSSGRWQNGVTSCWGNACVPRAKYCGAASLCLRPGGGYKRPRRLSTKVLRLMSWRRWNTQVRWRLHTSPNIRRPWRWPSAPSPDIAISVMLPESLERRASQLVPWRFLEIPKRRCPYCKRS